MTDDNDNLPRVNPFEPQKPESLPSTINDAEIQKQIADIQSALVIAKRFPRDPAKCFDVIIKSCQRPKLANEAIYSYKRGTTTVEGPTIRLAESIAQAWGNMEFGWYELSNENGRSEIGAFCWDWETNTKRTTKFFVSHKRFTREGSYVLSDPRDIYENNANNAQRRVRACILACLPGDVVEAAVLECYQTMRSNTDVTEKAIKQMLTIFETDYGVDRKAIEKWLGRRVESITAPQMVKLQNIRQSLRDEMSKVSDWFDIPEIKTPIKASKTDPTSFDKATKKADAKEVDDDGVVIEAPQETPEQEPVPEIDFSKLSAKAQSMCNIAKNAKDINSLDILTTLPDFNTLKEFEQNAVSSYIDSRRAALIP